MTRRLFTLLCAPLLLACQGQLLPGESDQGPDRPGGRGFGSLQGAQARANKRAAEAQQQINKAFGINRGGGVEIERRKKASFKDPNADQRDGDLVQIKSGAPTADQSGELGGGTASKGGKRAEEERRAGQRAALLSASEGIRDKLGRSGRRAPGKTLG